MAWFPVFSGSDAPDLASALGDMMLAWGKAEEEQVLLFAAILQISGDKASRLYQKLPNFRSRTQALLTLIDLHPEYAVTKADVLKLSKLSKTRNGYVHGLFIKDQASSAIRLCDLDEPYTSKARMRTTKANDVRTHADAVRQAASALSASKHGLQCYRDWKAALFLEL